MANAGCDAEVALGAIAMRLLQQMLMPEFVVRFRVVMAESGRCPELAEVYYRSGPERATARLAEFLAWLYEKGLLDIPEPHLAASQVFGMIWGAVPPPRARG